MQKLNGKSDDSVRGTERGLCGWKVLKLEKTAGLRPSRILWPKLGNVGL